MPKKFSFALAIILLAFAGYYLLNKYVPANLSTQLADDPPKFSMKLYAAMEKRGKLQVLSFRDENNSNKLVKEVRIRDLTDKAPSYITVDLVGWNAEKTEFWGKLLETSPYIFSIFYIQPYNNYQVVTYDLESKLGLWPTELAINTDKRLVVYSTYPGLLDEKKELDFKTAQTKVTLYMYNLETSETKELESVAAKKFNPYWLDAETLQYDNFYGSGKSTYSLAGAN